MTRYSCLACLLLGLLAAPWPAYQALPLGAQTLPASPGAAPAGPAAASPAAGTGATPAPAAPVQALQRGFEELQLGMSFEAAYRALQESTSLDYRGRPDVSLSPGREERIIETRGGIFVRRGIFQFRDQKLFAITLDLEPAWLDFYLLFQSLSEKYGPPASLDPRKVQWEDSQTRLVLEKPQTIKYIDLAVFNGIIQQQEVQKTLREEVRESFIKSL